MTVKDLIPVDYANQRVLTYKQIAQGLNCSIDLLRMHFKNHPEQFQEGVHYFKLEGSPLQEFKKGMINQHVNFAPSQKEITSDVEDRKKRMKRERVLTAKEKL